MQTFFHLIDVVYLAKDRYMTLFAIQFRISSDLKSPTARTASLDNDYNFSTAVKQEGICPYI